MKRAVVAGAGFSGLVSAYYLCKAGYQVRIVEKAQEPGGLIHSVQTPWGLCETAANAVMNSVSFEALAADIGLEILPGKLESRKRFIFRQKVKRWPLAVSETAAMAMKFAANKSRKPLPMESLGSWAHRVVGPVAANYLVAPAFTGIYAGDPNRLSATLTLHFLLNRRNKKLKPVLRGSVAPRGGMGELISSLEKYLRSKGATFEYGSDFELGASPAHDELQIIATNASAAGKILTKRSETLENLFLQIEILPLVRVTVFYPRTSARIEGFGVLFPRDQEVRSLGVLFDNFIFENRSEHLEESWILGGATDPKIMSLSDEDILSQVGKDRGVLYGISDLPGPVGYRIQRWPQAFPHFTVELEEILKKSRPEMERLEGEGIFLIGNYLKTLGLAQIVEMASELPARIASRRGAVLQ